MISRLKKDVSDSEIATHMEGRMADLMAHVVGGSTVPAPERTTSQEHTQSSTTETPTAKTSITQHEREFLESIIEQPHLSVTARRDFLGLSTWQNNERKKSLVAAGLVEEFSINLGKATGGILKLMDLTPAGYEALGKVPKAPRPLNCSAEHFWWQRLIATHYRQEGYDVEIEMHRNGVFADVGIVRDGKKTAVEVELTPKNAVANVQRDLAAGFDEVIVAARNTRVLKAIEDRLWSILAPDLHERVSLRLLADLPFAQELLKPTARRRALQGS